MEGHADEGGGEAFAGDIDEGEDEAIVGEEYDVDVVALDFIAGGGADGEGVAGEVGAELRWMTRAAARSIWTRSHSRVRSGCWALPTARADWRARPSSKSPSLRRSG